MNKTIMAKYVWELKWYVIKSVPSYSKITKSYKLYLHKKFEILTNPNQCELMNKRSELVSKCRHVDTQSARMSQKQDEHSIYVILKTMCPRQLSPQWLCGKSCTSAHDVYIHLGP